MNNRLLSFRRSAVALVIGSAALAFASLSAIRSRAELPMGAARIAALAEHLHFLPVATFNPSTLPQRRPTEYSTRKVLERIHPWLVSKSGSRERFRGENAFIELKRIPAEILSEIVRDTEDANLAAGLSILSHEFWRELDQLQTAGFTVGFVSHAESPFVGIYYGAERFLGFDIFANTGTILHERRHHQQREALRLRSAAAEEGSWYDFERFFREKLSYVCIARTSQYFGELDATTEQLSHWKGVVNALPVIPKDAAEAARVGGMHVMSVPQLISTNLEYPVSAANWIINERSCPQELKDVMVELAIALDAQKRKVADVTLDRLYRARGEIARLLTGNDPGAESPDSLQAKITVITQRVEEDKSRIEARLAEAAEARPRMIREILSRLPAKISRELCENASGFEFLSDCSPY